MAHFGPCQTSMEELYGENNQKLILPKKLHFRCWNQRWLLFGKLLEGIYRFCYRKTDHNCEIYCQQLFGIKGH